MKITENIKKNPYPIIYIVVGLVIVRFGLWSFDMFLHEELLVDMFQFFFYGIMLLMFGFVLTLKGFVNIGVEK